MTFYGEYTTLAELRTSGEGAQLNIANANADPFLLSLIRSVSRSIDQVSNRRFVPWVQTQVYDAITPNAWSALNPYMGGKAGDDLQSRTGGYAYSRILRLADDLLAVTTLTNGDGTVISAANYLLYPANAWPKDQIHLKQSSGLAWQPDSSGNYEQVISLAGVFGCHDDYPNAWMSAGTVADVAGINASVTSYTASAGHGIAAGALLKIESEYLYAAAVSGNTITVVRGVNGSTAATHATGMAVSVWGVLAGVSAACRMAAAALWNLRANPVGQTTSINGVSFQTPKDVTEWVQQELYNLGLVRMGMG